MSVRDMRLALKCRRCQKLCALVECPDWPAAKESALTRKAKPPAASASRNATLGNCATRIRRRPRRLGNTWKPREKSLERLRTHGHASQLCPPADG
jgi:hypothetical protein